jgi:hypothetical protein
LLLYVLILALEVGRRTEVDVEDAVETEVLLLGAISEGFALETCLV